MQSQASCSSNLKNKAALHCVRYKFAASSLIAASCIFYPFQNATASESCASLLKKIWMYPSIPFQWTTNYQASQRWDVGYGTGELKRPDAYLHFVGTAKRLLSNKQTGISSNNSASQPFDAKQPEFVDIDISGFGSSITFAGKYGPYNTTCIGDKFMIINTGDSVETFTFGNAPILK